MNKDSYHKEDVSKEKKPLPIGISDYIRAQAEYYYVDKTLIPLLVCLGKSQADSA